MLDYRSLESLPPKHLTPPRNDTVQHFNFNRERNGGENKPVDTEHSVALKPFTPSTHFQVNQTHPPFSSKPLILIYFSIKKSFILHVHKRKLWQESPRWWQALCLNNSALLHQCPSPHGQLGPSGDNNKSWDRSEFAAGTKRRKKSKVMRENSKVRMSGLRLCRDWFGQIVGHGLSVTVHSFSFNFTVCPN